MGFLKIVVLWIDFLLWPVIALGYPVCASIRAIETGSKYHMQKLVTYWTIFALISLFEIAFVKIIEWIPLWSCIKLIAICWLLFPQFKGTVQAYQSLVQPCLSMKLQAVISSFYKQKEEKMINSFLDVAEEYIKENGLEALEQLIISKRECKKPDSSHSGIQVQGPDEQNAAATPRPLQSRMYLLQQTLHHTQSGDVSWDDKKTDVLPEFKEMRSPEPKAEDSHPETPPPKKLQHEWTCSLCLVTTTCEKTLNAHLQGNKHKSKIEALRTSHHQEKGAESLPSVNSILNQGHLGAAKKEVGEGWQQKPSKKNEESVPFHLSNDWERQETMRNDKFVNQTFKLRCGICNVKLLSEIDMASHLKGKMHSSNIKKLWECKKPGSSHSDIQVQEPDEQNPAATPKQLKELNSAHKNIGMIEATEHTASSKPKPVQHAHSNNVGWAKKKTDAPAEVEQMIPPEAKAEARHPETPPPKKVQHEWMCTLCQVTATRKKMLNAHLRGKKHKAKIEALLTSGAAKKGVGEGSQKKPSKKNDEKVLEVKEMTPKAEDRPQEWTCALCQVTTTSEITLNAHFLGKKHKSKIEALKSSHHNEKGAGSLPSTNKTAKKNEERILSPLSREWPCTLCQVTTSSKKTLNDHLAGKKHKSKIM